MRIDEALLYRLRKMHSEGAPVKEMIIFLLQAGVPKPAFSAALHFGGHEFTERQKFSGV